jgi:hypothetical protein
MNDKKIILKSARSMALKDISNWIKENNIKIRDNKYDVCFVTSSMLNTKKQRKLNKELGINNINYFCNKNGEKKKIK